MNNKSKVITAILSILIIVLYFVNEKMIISLMKQAKLIKFIWMEKKLG